MKIPAMIEILQKLEAAHPGIEIVAALKDISAYSPIMFIKVADVEGVGRIGVIEGVNVETAREDIKKAKDKGLKVVFPLGGDPMDLDIH